MKSKQRGTKKQWHDCLEVYLGKSSTSNLDRRACQRVKGSAKRKKCLQAADRIRQARQELEGIINGN